MSEPAFNIPLMRPRLPEVPAILPYLEEIDQNRWYSNFGPLERRFERKLAEHFELGDRQVVCVSNCTQRFRYIASERGSISGRLLFDAFIYIRRNAARGHFRRIGAILS